MLDPLKNIVVIGDRILIKPLEASNKTGSGLYLPPSVREHDAVHTGIVVKVGPGYPLPVTQDSDAVFRGESPDEVKYLPLQVKEGDEVYQGQVKHHLLLIQFMLKGKEDMLKVCQHMRECF